MARRMTPNQKAWQREMLRIENMARSIGIEDVASIKPKTPDKITKKHIAQAEAITMDYVREKAELESAGIKQAKRAKQKKGKSVGGTKKPDYVHKPRRPLTEAEKQKRAENLRRGRQSLTHEQLSESAKKGAQKRKGSGKKAVTTKAKTREAVQNIPRASRVAVDNFFKSIEERLNSPRGRDDIAALEYFYNEMQGLLVNIGEAGFARLLFLADQEDLSVYLAIPPSEVNMEWAMGAVTNMTRIAKEHKLSYAKNMKDIWEGMDEKMGAENFEDEFR